MGFKPIPAAVALALTLIIWFVIPVPQGVSPDAWHLLALFVGIIAGIIGKAMPIGAMAILGITLVALTGVTNEKAADATKDALSSLNNSLIWMIGIAIIISRGLLKTGLGMRIGYLLISLFGKRTLGVGYSLALADLVIGPVTPSNTARGGAIVHPIMRSIALSFDSDPEKGTEGKSVNTSRWSTTTPTSSPAASSLPQPRPTRWSSNWSPKPPIRKSTSLGAHGSPPWSSPA